MAVLAISKFKKILELEQTIIILIKYDVHAVTGGRIVRNVAKLSKTEAQRQNKLADESIFGITGKVITLPLTDCNEF